VCSHVTRISTPDRRQCERCGRAEYWDDDAETWRIEVEDGDRRASNPYCIHEWDINGSFTPVES